MFESGGLYIDKSVALSAITSLIFTYFIFAIASYITAKKGIYKQY
jgi:hypothetical protein